jgi:hypothetical protein
MQFKQNNARPMVLRELSLLRALGASLRTSSSRRPGKLGRQSLPPTVLPPPGPFALPPRHGPAQLRPEEMTKATSDRLSD